jgi:AraC family transcriptional regulator
MGIGEQRIIRAAANSDFAMQPTVARGPNTTSLTSRSVEWRGGRATTQVVRYHGNEADVLPEKLQLTFAFRADTAFGEAQSYGKVKGRNAPRCAFVHPPGVEVLWRVRELTNQELVTVEFEDEFLLRSAELQHLSSIQISDAWYHEDALSWQLGKVIFDECSAGCPQGLLFLETAATLLALHTVRTFSAYKDASEVVRRGGLAPNSMRRACDYLMSRFDQELSLQEVAAVTGLSPGHFAFAFKKTSGLTPFAWVRQKRIERAKSLLLESLFDLKAIAQIVGYANQSAFGVAFKKETGLTPTQWQRMRLIR